MGFESSPWTQSCLPSMVYMCTGALWPMHAWVWLAECFILSKEIHFHMWCGTRVDLYREHPQVTPVTCPLSGKRGRFLEEQERLRWLDAYAVG